MYFEDSLKLREEYGNKEELARSLSDYGSMYYYKRDYDECLKYYKKSLVIAKEYDFESLISLNLQLIANAYLYKQDMELAEEKTNEAIKFSIKIGDAEEIAYAKEILAKIYLYKNDLSKAGILFEENLFLWHTNNELALSYTLYNLVSIYIELRMIKNVDRFLKELKQLSLTSKRDLVQIRYKLVKAKSLIHKDHSNNFITALRLLCEVVGDKHSQPDIKLNAYLILCKILLLKIKKSYSKNYIDELEIVIGNLQTYTIELNVKTLFVKGYYLKFCIMLYTQQGNAINQLHEAIKLAQLHKIKELENNFQDKLNNYDHFIGSKTKEEIINEALGIISYDLKLQNYIYEIRK